MCDDINRKAIAEHFVSLGIGDSCGVAYWERLEFFTFFGCIKAQAMNVLNT